MKPEDICVHRLDDLAQVAGDRRPSIEFRLHAQVLRIRRDCRASIHTHQPVASAYTLLGRALEIHHPYHQIILGQKAAFVGYAPSGTNWLASKLRKAFRPEINAYLMRNHGALCLWSHAGRDSGQSRSSGVCLRHLFSRCNQTIGQSLTASRFCPK